MDTFICADNNQLYNDKTIRWFRNIDLTFEICCKNDNCKTNIDTISLSKEKNPKSYEKLTNLSYEFIRTDDNKYINKSYITTIRYIGSSFEICTKDSECKSDDLYIVSRKYVPNSYNILNKIYIKS
jgi:hypothetical protein